MRRLSTYFTKYKRITSDFAYNILASAINTGVLQIIVYPFLAYIFEPDAYGEMLTLIGIIYICSVAFGNSLNNVRLMQNTEYIKINKEGDFNFLLIISNSIALIIVLFIIVLFFKLEIEFVILLCFLEVLEIVKAYYSVAYRVLLDFVKNLKMTIIGAIGAIFGCCLVYIIDVWPVIFIISDCCCLFYIFRTTKIYREALTRTELFKQTTSKYIILIGTGIISNILTYLDRIILYPVVGGTAVSVYTVSAFFGKSFGLVVMPISSVLLGYYAQKNFKMDRKKFWKINVIALLASLVFFVVSLVIATPITGFLYPKIILYAEQYILLANIGAILNVLSLITQPAILKFVDTRMQIIKELLYALIYVIGCITMVPKYGVEGLCYVMIVANAVKLIFLYIIGTYCLPLNK